MPTRQVRHGSARDFALTFHWLIFDSARQWLAGHDEWLCTKGCVDFKYDFNYEPGGIDTDDLAQY